MNRSFPKEDTDRRVLDTAAAGEQTAALATGPMFTHKDTTDDPGVASNGEPLPDTRDGGTG